MDKIVRFSFGEYGTNKHPVIWIKVDGSVGDKFIYLNDVNDAMHTLHDQINKYLDVGFKVEWMK
jgi:hypothetical protein